MFSQIYSESHKKLQANSQLAPFLQLLSKLLLFPKRFNIPFTSFYLRPLLFNFLIIRMILLIIY